MSRFSSLTTRQQLQNNLDCAIKDLELASYQVLFFTKRNNAANIARYSAERDALEKVVTLLSDAVVLPNDQVNLPKETIEPLKKNYFSTLPYVPAVKTDCAFVETKRDSSHKGNIPNKIC